MKFLVILSIALTANSASAFPQSSENYEDYKLVSAQICELPSKQVPVNITEIIPVIAAFLIRQNKQKEGQVLLKLKSEAVCALWAKFNPDG